MRDKYLKILANASTTYRHELILECLNYYGVNGTKELTEEQVLIFCRKKGLVN